MKQTNEPRKGCCDRCGELACDEDEYVCPPCKGVLYQGKPAHTAPIDPFAIGQGAR